MSLRLGTLSRSVAPALLPFTLVLLQACDDGKNTAPGAPAVSIGPVSPGTGDDLVAVVRSDAADEEGDAVTYRYAWLRDGLPRDELTTDTVPASETTKGELWEVVVTPNDGELDGEEGTASTTILNTPPELTLAFSPEAPTTDDDVVAVATAIDADGDAVTVTWAWTLDGAPDDTAADTITADRTERGQLWGVTATPSDDEEAGTSATAEVEIANAAPVVLAVELAPLDPFVTDDVVATVESFDSDGDVVAYTFTWLVDGAEVQSGESATLAAGNFEKHQLVKVEVVPNDGMDDGEAVASTEVEVQNSLPTATGATIDPVPAFEASTLTCVAAGFADADADAEGWTYGWSVNGAEVASTATLDGTAFSKGDSVVCTATPFDGEEAGAPVSSEALIVSNTPPVLASAELSSDAPTESDTVTVTLGGGTDDDGDLVSYAYEWYVDGAPVSTSESLLPSSFAKGDSITVVITPWDGTDWGSPVTSAVAIGANSTPSISSVTLTPTSVYTDDTLTATVLATDLDGDSVAYTYDWVVDGVPLGSTASASLDGTTSFDKGQSVYVIVTPDDGEDSGATGTSATVTVLNSPPTAPVVAISPADALAGEDLTCAITTASSDADGDAITYTFDWDVDGATFSGAVDGATSSVVDGADVGEGEVWTCDVVADDGEDTASATDGVTVGGAPVSILVLSGTDSAGNSHVTDSELSADFVNASGLAPTITHGTVAPTSAAGYAGYDVVILSEDGADAYASVIGSTFDSAAVDALLAFWEAGGNVYFAREYGSDAVMNDLYWEISGGSGYWSGNTTRGYSTTISANAGTLFAGTTRAFLETGASSSELGNPTLLAPFVNAFNLPGHTPTVATVVYVCESDGSGLLVIDGERGTPWYSAPTATVNPASGTFGPAVGDLMSGGSTWSPTADCADSDRDGIKNGVEGYTADSDGDGTLDYLDPR